MELKDTLSGKTPDILSFAQSTPIETLGLSDQLFQKLAEAGITNTMKVYILLMPFRKSRKTTKGFALEELEAIDQKFNQCWESYRLPQPTSTPIPESRPPIPAPTPSKPLTSTQKNLLRTQPSFLDTVEAKLRPQLRHISLIGEIPMEQDEVTEVGHHLGNLFKRYTQEDALRLIEHHYPASVAVFLVQQGIFGYRGGDYWTSVGEVMGINHSNVTNRLGQVFERILRRNGLPQFPDVQEQSARYVSIILAHGGIPAYCLNDFFGEIIYPTLRGSHYEYLDEDELINEVLHRAKGYQNVDKPILRFLENGGRVATNFFQRVREMAKVWTREQRQLSTDEAGLPQYVLSAYERWLETRELDLNVQEPRNRLRRPELCLDPWGLGIYLRLPSQPISQFNLHTLEWTVETNLIHSIPVNLTNFGGQPETEQVLWRLSAPQTNYPIQFVLNEQISTWKIEGVNEKQPILFFDVQRGIALSRPPAGPVWLVYPRGYTLETDNPEAQLTEDLPWLLDEWYPYVAEAWDLSGATFLSLRTAEGLTTDIPLKVLEKYGKPELVGGHHINVFADPGTPLLYAGNLPNLHIPISGDHQNLDLARWKLTIQTQGEADPSSVPAVSLADLPLGAIDTKPDLIRVLLGHARLFGNHPMGRFTLSIRGPLGSDASFDLVFLPDFIVDGSEKLYVPDAHLGSTSLKLPITTGLMNQIEVAEASSGLAINMIRPGQFILQVPANKAKVNLKVTRSDLSQRIQVPVAFRLRRLRWQIIKDQAQGGNWVVQVDTKSMRWFLIQEKPILLVDLPIPSTEGVQLKLSLLQVDGTVLQVVETKTRAGNQSGRFWRFELGAFKTTVQTSKSPILRFELEILGLQELQQVVRVPVLSLTQQIQISNLHIEHLETAGGSLLMLNWVEKTPMSCRGLQMWSLWRPWQPPLVLPIPDEAEQQAVLEIPYTLEPGRYRFVFTILNPWSNAKPPLFPPESDEIKFLDVEWGDIESRLFFLKGDKTQHLREFDRLMEQICILHAINDIQRFKPTFENVCEHLIWATSIQIQVIHRLLEKLPQMDIERKFFGHALILPNRLKVLVSDVENHRLEANLFSDLMKTYTNPEDWDISTCQLLISLPDPTFQLSVLKQLIARDRKQAIPNLIHLVEKQQLSLEVAADFLLEDKHFNKSLLKTHSPHNPVASDLFYILEKANPLEGLPIIEPGHWVFSEIGWGRIERIEDPENHQSLESFIEGKGRYRLHVSLHIELSADFVGEKAVLDMRTNQAHFLRARELFVCKACNELVTQDRKTYRNHLSYMHPGAPPQPAISGNVYPLTQYRFERRRNKEN